MYVNFGCKSSTTLYLTTHFFGAQGWRSVYVNEPGEVLAWCTHQPTNLSWRIKQVLRWHQGAVQILYGKVSTKNWRLTLVKSVMSTLLIDIEKLGTGFNPFAAYIPTFLGVLVTGHSLYKHRRVVPYHLAPDICLRSGYILPSGNPACFLHTMWQ